MLHTFGPALAEKGARARARTNLHAVRFEMQMSVSRRYKPPGCRFHPSPIRDYNPFAVSILRSESVGESVRVTE